MCTETYMSLSSANTGWVGMLLPTLEESSIFVFLTQLRKVDHEMYKDYLQEE